MAPYYRSLVLLGHGGRPGQGSRRRARDPGVQAKEPAAS
jgi:hypothetical protein